MDRQVDEIN